MEVEVSRGRGAYATEILVHIACPIIPRQDVKVRHVLNQGLGVVPLRRGFGRTSAIRPYNLELCVGSAESVEDVSEALYSVCEHVDPDVALDEYDFEIEARLLGC